MRLSRFALLIFLCSLPQSSTSAQWVGYAGNFVGTAASAEAHGLADIIRSEGIAYERTTQGMVNFEEARGKYIENARKAFDFQMSRKRTLAAENEKEREKKRAELARHLTYYNSHPQKPPRLTEDKLNSTTGQIKWPLALQDSCFTSQRHEMEKLFAMRAQSGLTSEISMSVETKSKQFKRDLSKEIKRFVQTQYIQARKFLESLPFEAL